MSQDAFPAHLAGRRHQRVRDSLTLLPLTLSTTSVVLTMSSHPSPISTGISIAVAVLLVAEVLLIVIHPPSTRLSAGGVDRRPFLTWKHTPWEDVIALQVVRHTVAPASVHLSVRASTRLRELPGVSIEEAEALTAWLGLPLDTPGDRYRRGVVQHRR